jgi:hypothetical protein
VLFFLPLLSRIGGVDQRLAEGGQEQENRSMSLIFGCRCGAQLTVPAELIGRDVRCPKCAAVAKAVPPPNAVPEGISAGQPDPGEPKGPPPGPPKPLAEVKPRYPDVDHTGQPLPGDADFFAPPPAEIGTVVSGDTTLRQHHQPWPLWAIITAVLMGAVAGLLAGVAATYAFGVDWWVWKTCCIAAAVLVGLFVGLGISSFMHTCVYVGTDGVATLTCQNSRAEVASPKLFLFKDADNLWTDITHHYKLGVYGRTTWSFVWADPQGKPVYRLRGTYFQEKGPKASDEYHLGCAAAGAWTHFLQTRFADRLARGERVRFALKRPGDWIDLAHGNITFCLGAPPVTWTRDEIDVVEAVKDDRIVFKHRRHKEGVFSSEGIYAIKAHEMANVQVFFRLLPETIGFSIR